MDGEDKSKVIQILAKIDPNNYDVFVRTSNRLCANTDKWLYKILGFICCEHYLESDEKLIIIESLFKVEFNHYQLFVRTVSALSKCMDGWDKSLVIAALAEVQPQKYTLEFINTVNALSEGLYITFEVDRLIRALGNVDSRLYGDELFINTVNTLSIGTHGHCKSYIIEALATVVPINYQLFVRAVNELSESMDAGDVLFVIQTLAKLDPINYQLFIDTVNALSEGMNGKDTIKVIKELAKVDPLKYTPEFIDTANTLSESMNGDDKSSVISALTKFDPANYELFKGIVNALSKGMVQMIKYL